MPRGESQNASLLAPITTEPQEKVRNVPDMAEGNGSTSKPLKVGILFKRSDYLKVRQSLCAARDC